MRLDPFAALPLLLLLALGVTTASAADPGFAAEWTAWHEQREARLRAEDGWLALVGLHWLAPGENRMPELPGVFVLGGDGRVTLRAAPGDGYTLGGAPVAERALATDAGGKAPDKLRVGDRTVAVIDRGGKLALRVWDAASPVRTGFHGLDAFPPHARWRIEARWEPYPSPREVQVPSVIGTPTREKVPGRAVFTVGGKALSLEPIDEDGELFFVFKDATAPSETYGAGRFLYAVGAPKDGKVILDFNRAYSPPCAFTPYATCPLPRPENVLPVRIEAGEKKPAGH